MKTSVACIVILSCVALGASFAVDPQSIPLPRNEECASTCLWSGVYNVPSFQSCRRFSHCVHGFLFDLECDEGEEFDHITLTCQPEAMGRCVLEGPVASSEETSEGTSEETAFEELFKLL